LRHCIKLLLPLLLISYLPSEAVNASEDAYYTWVDENGVTNFAAEDPKEYESTYVKGSQHFGQLNRPKAAKPSPEETPASSKQEADPEIEIQEERKDIKEQIAKIRASNCEIGKRNLAKLEAYARIRIMEEDGTERVITEEEKQARTNKARKTITENCMKG
jgi:hypothetical protein